MASLFVNSEDPDQTLHDDKTLQDDNTPHSVVVNVGLHSLPVARFGFSRHKCVKGKGKVTQKYI